MLNYRIKNIFVNEKYEKTKAYYFNKIEDKYDFDYAKKEEVDEECIKKIKENPVNNYLKQSKSQDKIFNCEKNNQYCLSSILFYINKYISFFRIYAWY